ncbi:MAG: hypothetical protein Fur0046_27320 [Cyanobacteria bacterium J069]
MRVWAAGVVLFFVMAELYPWMQGLDLPLPLMVAAGLGLAIASNLPLLRGGGRSPQIAPKPPPKAPSSETTQPINPTPTPQRPPTQLPNVNPAPPAPPPRPISFTIRKPGNS